VEDWARAEGLSLARVGSADATTDVVLVDRTGVLGDLYSLATAAFVGGGFHGAGLHSVLEPAAFGVPVAFGPRHSNSREAFHLTAAVAGTPSPRPTTPSSFCSNGSATRRHANSPAPRRAPSCSAALAPVNARTNW
jgi:hypothetical protein